MASNPPKSSEAGTEATPLGVAEENKCLVQLTREIDKLKIEFSKREQLIKELESQKERNEVELHDLQASVDNKFNEIEKESLLKKADFLIENDWKEKVRKALRKKITAAVEYQNKMARLRNEVLSSHNLNDVKVSEEIDNMKNTYENICRWNEMLQLNIADAQDKLDTETEAWDVTDGINLLIKQLRREADDDRQKTRKLIDKSLRLQEKIKKISNDN